MPDWLIIIIFCLVFFGVTGLAFYAGNTRGYFKGYCDRLEEGYQLDAVLRGKHDPPRPPKRPHFPAS